MVYFANFQHIYFLSKLTFCTISVKTYFLYNHTSSSRFAIRGGTIGKCFEGWMGPIQIGTRVASASHHVLLYVVVPHGSHVRDGWDLF
jgi:hypothetical protein